MMERVSEGILRAAWEETIHYTMHIDKALSTRTGAGAFKQW